MYHVLTVSGSLRAGSANTGLVRMAGRLAPPELVIHIYRDIAALPYYNADLDQDDVLPEPVQRWRDAVTGADALLLAAPEYNYGPTAVMKNALDWASRPLGAHSIQGKVVTVVGSGGGGGGRRVQAQFNEIIGLLGNAMVTEPEIALVKGSTFVSADGTTTDPEVEALMAARLANLLAALAARAAR